MADHFRQSLVPLPCFLQQRFVLLVLQIRIVNSHLLRQVQLVLLSLLLRSLELSLGGLMVGLRFCRRLSTLTQLPTTTAISPASAVISLIHRASGERSPPLESFSAAPLGGTECPLVLFHHSSPIWTAWGNVLRLGHIRPAFDPIAANSPQGRCRICKESLILPALRGSPA